MRKIFLFIIVCALTTVISCSETPQEDRAMTAAKEYYDSLLAGNYAYFIRSTNLPDTIPDSYREQLETNLKMFIAKQQEEHQGITAANAMRSEYDTITSNAGKADIHTANVFMELQFGDNLKEEIVVPMVEKNDKWLMR